MRDDGHLQIWHGGHANWYATTIGAWYATASIPLNQTPFVMRRQFMQNFLPKMNIGVSVIKPNDFTALNEALDKHKVRGWFIHVAGIFLICIFSLLSFDGLLLLS